MSRREVFETAQEVIEAQDDYIALLGAEIDDMVGLLYVHGWRSTRVAEGEEARERIRIGKEKLNPTPQP